MSRTTWLHMQDMLPEWGSSMSSMAMQAADLSVGAQHGPLPEHAVIHQCPVCQRLHAVHPVLHRVAYGKQLTCSPRCKLRWKQQVRQAIYQRQQKRPASQ